MTQTRRDFLRATAGVASGLALAARARAGGGGGQQALRVRRDVATLNANSPDIVALKAAVTKMKALPGNDRRNWRAQATIHGTLNPDVFLSCQHGSWYFLPWHRAYLYYFEEIVRGLSGNNNFALPYWDWSRTHSLPGLFWGAGNPLDNPARPNEPGSGRKPTLNPNTQFTSQELFTYVGEARIAQILGIAVFTVFGGSAVAQPGEEGEQGRLENGPHNFVHRWVGGDMVSGGSPYDPIFWLHHCNIDRLWSEWALKHPQGTPSNPAWLNTPFRDFCDRDGNPAAKTVAQTLNTADLGYRYAPRDEPVAVQPRARPTVLGTLQTAERTVADGTVSFLMGAAADQAGLVNEATQGPALERKPSVRLSLRGVKPPRNPDTSLDVYVNCLKLSKDTPVTDPSYSGSCTFFGHGRHAHGREGAGDVSFQFDLTPTFVRLYADRPFRADEPLKVSIIARPLFPGTPGAPAVEIQEVSPTQVSIEVISPNG